MKHKLTQKELNKIKKDFQKEHPELPITDKALQIMYGIVMDQMNKLILKNRNEISPIPEKIAQYPLRPDECFQIEDPDFLEWSNLKKLGINNRSKYLGIDGQLIPKDEIYYNHNTLVDGDMIQGSNIGEILCYRKKEQSYELVNDNPCNYYLSTIYQKWKLK